MTKLDKAARELADAWIALVTLKTLPRSQHIPSVVFKAVQSRYEKALSDHELATKKRFNSNE